MDALKQNIENLISSIRESEIYRNYKIEEKKMMENPELMKRIDLFRQNSFRLQEEISKDNLFDRTDNLNRESSDLRKSEDVNAYLDAELAVCKMIQKICLDITSGIEVHIPEI